MIKISADQNVWKVTNDISIFSGVKSVRFQDLLTSGIIWQFFKTPILGGDEIFAAHVRLWGHHVWFWFDPISPPKHELVRGRGEGMTLSVQVARSLDQGGKGKREVEGRVWEMSRCSDNQTSSWVSDQQTNNQHIPLYSQDFLLSRKYQDFNIYY